MTAESAQMTITPTHLFECSYVSRSVKTKSWFCKANCSNWPRLRWEAGSIFSRNKACMFWNQLGLASRRYQLWLNKARCQTQRAKTTCFTEKCGEPDGRWRPGWSRAPSSCVWLGRDLDSSRTRPGRANVHRFSIFILYIIYLFCLKLSVKTQFMKMLNFSFHGFKF